MVLRLNNISKSFGSLKVLENVSMELQSPNIYCLMAPSGAGKTTLFRIITGLETADSGSIEGIDSKTRISVVFQEDRLCENVTPAENIMLVTGKAYTKEEAEAELLNILPREALSKPVRELSGGMKRRTAICRALLAPADLILMDEPFTGIDEETRLKVSEYIKKKAAGKLLLFSTHHEEDIAPLGATLLTL